MELTLQEYQILFENVPAFIVVVDPNYIIVQANQSFKDTFGADVGQPCYQAYKGLGQKCPECLVEKTFRERKPQVSEECGRTKEGAAIPYWVRTAPIFNPRGEISYVIEMSVDLREKKRLEGELRASRDFLNTLIENAFDGIVAVDPWGRVIVFNRAAEKILGYPSSEALGSERPEKYFPRYFSRKITEYLKGRGEKSPPVTTVRETYLTSKTGERIPVRFSGRILLQELCPVGAVGFFQDLRPLKSLEREKLQAERLAAVGQTVAGLAHGMKNIITGLEGGLFAVQKGGRVQDDKLLQKGVEMIERNVGKISGLVQELLKHSRRPPPDLRWAAPNELVEEACSLFQEKAGQGQIQLVLDLDPHIGPAYLDPKGISTCLTNLLSNALDACLLDREKSPHRVTVRTRRNEDQSISFEVEDNGIGMTDEVKSKLFTIFFSTKGASGTGLGLFVTQKIVQELGGSLSVETEPQRGSRFSITLPQEELPPRRT